VTDGIVGRRDPRLTVGRLLARTLGLALPLYLASLGLGLVGTTLALVGLSAAADRPWLVDLLGPGWLNTLVEVGVSTVAAPDSDRSAVGLLALESAIVPPLLLVSQWIAYTFIAGGILERLLVRDSRRVAAARFSAGCHRWFWPFVHLGLMGLLLLGILVAIGALVSVLIGRIVGVTVSFLMLVAWVAILLGWQEVGRAAMVWHGDRSAGLAFQRAARVIVRPRALLLWLFLALPGAGLLAVAASRPSGSDPTSALSTLATLVLGQVCAFLGAWLKVIRLAAASRLVASADESSRRSRLRAG
jgi:hypothetical protein